MQIPVTHPLTEGDRMNCLPLTAVPAGQLRTQTAGSVLTAVPAGQLRTHAAIPGSGNRISLI